MNSAEISVLLSCISIFVAFVMILTNVMVNRKEKKYIKSIKVGDIFCFRTDVNSYYRKIEEYKHELENPFRSNHRPLCFPSSTCIIKELKESKSGETWVCFVVIRNPEDINNVEKLSISAEHYESLNEFLEYRERVERFEI